jgi:hypothetical protein
MYPDKAGKLEVGRSVRSGGKVVDEWKYVSPFTGRGEGPKPPPLVVEIAIVKGEKEGIVFEARSSGLPKEGVRDRDIEALRQKVEEALRFQHDILTGVPWDDWLEIAVSGSLTDGSTYEGIQANVKLSYIKLKRGVDPKTGKAYVVNSNHIAVSFPLPKKAGERDAEQIDSHGFSLGGRELNTEYSYLPATPDNLAALQDLQNRVNELRVRMSAFLNQGTVQQSLANVANGMLSLPAPL